MPPDALISARQLTKEHRVGTKTIRALWRVDLEVSRGEIVAVVGESGSGKSTLAEQILGIQAPTSGELLYCGQPLPAARPRALRRLIQLVPQNPMSALNPKRTVFQSVGLPLSVHDIGPRAGRRQRVAELLELVGLPSEIMDRSPEILSGGQRQRVAIARALASEPDVVVLDEPTSALDVSVQARVLRLLMDIYRRFSLTFIFITHDLAVARILASRVVVLYRGEVVEYGPTTAVLFSPRHRYTQMLVSSLPVVSEAEERLKPDWPWTKKAQIETAAASGCPFNARCPYVLQECFRQSPEMTEFGDGHAARCLNPRQSSAQAEKATPARQN